MPQGRELGFHNDDLKEEQMEKVFSHAVVFFSMKLFEQAES
jgi:hypothetical protein